MLKDFNCEICNFEEKSIKTNFCKICNSLKNKITRCSKKLKLTINSKDKSRKNLIQIKYKTEYLLNLRKGLNNKNKISSMDLEYLYNNIEIFLKRKPEIMATYHYANQFDSLSQRNKSFLYITLSNILFNSIKNIKPNTIWFLFKTNYPWED